jgi:CHAT domain-containing protein
MRPCRPFSLWLLAVVWLLAGAALAPGAPGRRSPNRAAPPVAAKLRTADQQAIRALVTRYFASREKQDLAGVMACWAQKSPQWEEIRRTTQTVFVNRPGARYLDLRFSRWKTAGSSASVRVRFLWGAPGAGSQASGDETLVDFRFARENGRWLFWGMRDPVRALLDALHAAPTPQERARLLAGERDLATPSLVGTLNGMAADSMAHSRFAEARATNQIAFEVAEALKDPVQQAWCFASRSNIHYAQYEYPQALESLVSALKLFREGRDRPSEALALGSIGTAREAIYDYPAALDAYRESQRLYAALGDRAQEAQQWSNAACALILMGKYDEALKAASSGIEICRDLKDRAGEAQLMLRVGNGYLATARYFRALDAFKGSLEIADATHDGSAAVSSLLGIGWICIVSGEPAQALAAYGDALTIARQVHNRSGEAAALAGIGAGQQLKGDPAKALEEYEASLKLAREFRQPWTEAAAQLGMSEAYLHLRRYDEARAAAGAGLEILRTIRDRVREADALRRLGDISTAAQRYDEAAEQYRAALDIPPARRDPEMLARIYGGQGRMYRAQKKWATAIEAFQQSADQVESVRLRNVHLDFLQAGLFGQNVEPYYLLVDCMLQAGSRETEAFALSERAQSRTLVDRLPGGISSVIRDVIKEGGDIVFTVDRLQFDSPTLPELNRTLFTRQPKMLVLSYLSSKEGVLLFALRGGEGPQQPARLSVHRLEVDAEELSQRVQEMRLRCATDEGRVAVRGERLAVAARPAGYQDVARSLYQTLLGPARDELDQADQVVIVAPGSLAALPFQALIDAQGRHLVETHAVSYAFSVTALWKMFNLASDRRAGQSGDHGEGPVLFAVGRPAFGGDLEDLPASEGEVRAIGRLFGAGALVLTGREATAARAKAEMGRARYLHFATHGLLSTDLAGQSAIALAREGKDDGRLHAWDIDELKLQAELVVLSACETVLGRQYGGEGILGLCWAFIAAGSHSCVATQWSVADESTSQLMVHFYGSLLNEAPSKAEALRRAQLALMRDGKHAHPYYWAPFVLIGDSR